MLAAERSFTAIELSMYKPSFEDALNAVTIRECKGARRIGRRRLNAPRWQQRRDLLGPRILEPIAEARENEAGVGRRAFRKVGEGRHRIVEEHHAMARHDERR